MSPDAGLRNVEPHEVSVSPCLQLVEVPLDDSTTLWHINPSSQLSAISRVAESTRSAPQHHHPWRSLMKMFVQDCNQHWTLGYTASYWLSGLAALSVSPTHWHNQTTQPFTTKLSSVCHHVKFILAQKRGTKIFVEGISSKPGERREERTAQDGLFFCHCPTSPPVNTKVFFLPPHRPKILAVFLHLCLRFCTKGLVGV